MFVWHTQEYSIFYLLHFSGMLKHGASCVCRVVTPPRFKPLHDPGNIGLELLHTIAGDLVHGLLGIGLLGFLQHHLHDLALNVLPDFLLVVTPAEQNTAVSILSLVHGGGPIMIEAS